MDKPVHGKPQATSTLASGVAILASAAIISKLLGTLQKIPLQNIGGDEVFGIYHAVYPLYTLILFMATAGFPVAVSRFVSEYMVNHDTVGAKRVVRVGSAILLATGVFSFAVCFFGAERIAILIGNPQTTLAVRTASLALLFVPPMAVLRGYFQGQQNMLPTGISQVMEQLIRVATMVALLLYFTKVGRSAEWIASGAMLGTVTGAIAGLIVMYIFKWREGQSGQSMKSESPPLEREESYASLALRMLKFAIPVCLGAIVVPILSIVDAFTIPRMLQHAGWSAAEAMQQFGIYTRGLPLVQLVAMIFSSLSVALVPSIADAKFRRSNTAIKQRAEISLRFTWLIGWAASTGLALTAIPINRMLFMDDRGSTSMALLAFTAVFSVLNIVSASILQGVGKAVIPALSLLIAAGVKVGLNLLWIPNWGIEGAAAAAIITFAIASIINVVTIRKMIRLRFNWYTYIVKPVLALLAMGGIIWLWLQCWHWLGQHTVMNVELRSFATLSSLSSVLLGMFVYLLLLVRLGTITAHEIAHIPKIGEKLIDVLQRLRLFKEESR